jgi:hypothetical protein
MPRCPGLSLVVLLCGALSGGCGRAPQPASDQQSAVAAGAHHAAGRLTIRIPNMRVRLDIT